MLKQDGKVRIAGPAAMGHRAGGLICAIQAIIEIVEDPDTPRHPRHGDGAYEGAIAALPEPREILGPGKP